MFNGLASGPFFAATALHDEWKAKLNSGCLTSHGNDWLRVSMYWLQPVKHNATLQMPSFEGVSFRICHLEKSIGWNIIAILSILSMLTVRWGVQQEERLQVHYLSLFSFSVHPLAEFQPPQWHTAWGFVLFHISSSTQRVPLRTAKPHATMPRWQMKRIIDQADHSFHSHAVMTHK